MRSFVIWGIFSAFNSARSGWFYFDKQAWYHYWLPSEYVAVALQIAVSIEAMFLLSAKVGNFSWRYRLMACLALPGVAAAATARTPMNIRSLSLFLNEALGFGLGTMVLLACLLGVLVRPICTNRAIFHAGVVASMWMVSGWGFRIYKSHWMGPIMVAWVPMALSVIWVLWVERLNDTVPEVDAAELATESEKLRAGKRMVGLG